MTPNAQPATPLSMPNAPIPVAASAPALSPRGAWDVPAASGVPAEEQRRLVGEAGNFPWNSSEISLHSPLSNHPHFFQHPIQHSVFSSRSKHLLCILFP